jgi:aspartyl-tRNA(Asn)/glutamyl-tRNA(Gln) amidotransferase subunit A
MAVPADDLPALAERLRTGATSATRLVEDALARIALDPSPFTYVAARRARRDAEESGQRLKAGKARSLLEGVPLSVKDLFDVEGEVTAAGSVVCRDAPPATRDAPVVSLLRRAGAVIVGRTHMSEFAFTGLGDNPHFPRCSNPLDESRVPGGSSSGAAASVARGQAYVGVGTDTGGSIRIPASFCGLTGFKPTQRRVSREGAFVLSPTQDSIGPIARTVTCCAIVDQILSGTDGGPLADISLSGRRLAVPQDYVLDGLEPAVSAAFQAGLSRLSKAGMIISEVRFPHFNNLPELFAQGTIVNAEAHAHHSAQGLLERREQYDPMVIARIDLGGRMLADAVQRLRDERVRMMEETNRLSASYDALALPTTPGVAPRYDEITTPADFGRHNARALRNTSLFNFLNRCAISLPLPVEGSMPVGLMLVGETLGDQRLLMLAKAVESALQSR